MFIALYEPEIPANAGNVARLCAATGTALHLIGRLGFSFRHPAARRAGMDYWQSVEVHRHVSFADFRETFAAHRIWAFTTRATMTFWEARYSRDDILLFGPESRGLPDDLLDSSATTAVRIPILRTARSLNLATSVGVGLYEAIRQTSGTSIS